MSAPYNLLILTDNPVLRYLIEEQVSAQKIFSCHDGKKPDCIIAQYGTSLPSSYVCPVLEVPKGAIRLGEILDRLRYLLSGRESHIEDDALRIDIGDFELSPADNILLHLPSDTVVHLTDKERLLIRVLYDAGETGKSRRDLLRDVWGYADDAETHTLETHIYRLRQKLESFGAQNMIEAIDGSYVLNTAL